MAFPKYLFILSSLLILLVVYTCSKKNNIKPGFPVLPDPVLPNDMDYWLTKSDQSVLLQKQPTFLSFSDTALNNYPNILIDSTISYQSIDGFGYTLTGSSATLINKMEKSARESLLKELFTNDSGSLGISYLRISIGASDLSSSVFSYDDIPNGQVDLSLAHFNLSNDTIDLIPILKNIIAINPTIKIMGSPWSPPAWMKDNNSPKGGSLVPGYYKVYAQYFVKYIKAMKGNGIPIDAITIQNEPQNENNNPSLLMSATQQADFIKNDLGPAFTTNSIQTKILIWDHNCDNPAYPLFILNDPGAAPFVSGTAFHLYGGDITALSVVHKDFPLKDVYFTEQWTSASGNFGGDLLWHIKNVVIGSMRNWSKVALEWNLANDPNFGPHTPGGCTECKGAITINGSTIQRNVSYYIIAHASKFIPPGSKRISSVSDSNLIHVAFKTPSGKKVLLVLNEGTNTINFNISHGGKKVKVTLDAGSVGTFIW
ncbi:MAG: glycoside hydrolase family 30 beta sandwich domain-containing protein [Saprospiraceae bacterium]